MALTNLCALTTHASRIHRQRRKLHLMLSSEIHRHLQHLQVTSVQPSHRSALRVSPDAIAVLELGGLAMHRLLDECGPQTLLLFVGVDIMTHSGLSLQKNDYMPMLIHPPRKLLVIPPHVCSEPVLSSLHLHLFRPRGCLTKVILSQCALR